MREHKVRSRERSDSAPASSDAAVIASLQDVRGVYRNPTGWYNNASFLLPLAAALLVGLVGALRQSTGLLEFAGFLVAVTLLMLPLVLLTWRGTATSVVLTQSEIVSLHSGRVLKSLPWSEVRTIRRRETQGNVRWEIAAVDGERILLDGELEDLSGLLRLAHRLAELRDEA